MSGFELNVSQKLGNTIAPQMQQSLQMLQASTLELESIVQQELQANPVLEEILDKPKDNESGEDASGAEDDFDEFGQSDYDPGYQSDRNSRQIDDERRQFFFDSVTERESLQQHLMGQIPLSEIGDADKKTAELLIGSIDDRGYLATPLEELSYTSGILESDLERVLAVIQTFHPVGVGARNLSECLAIQLDRLGKRGSIEWVIVTGHLDALSHKKYPDIARQLKIPVTEVQRAADFIATLSPRPGSLFSSDPDQYIVPDVEIRRVDGDFVIIMNDARIPNLRISDTYKDMMGSESRGEVRHYIRDKIRAGKFLIKSIHQRQQTIQNIARELLRHQREFFERGKAHLKPLTMAEVAADVGVHETTVSRAIANKYIQTPFGIFEMKYFFTTGYTSDSGEVVSNSSVKDALAELVRGEDPKRPYSDMEIVDLLQKKGIPIARRTVAKYRQELNILPSNLRRTF
ncbi:RNA polymerase factor sigma-54 [Oscillatoria laete-virens NRMC-F 0139]|nr:RNA polymerase factor sigma-54 [Oscillatoria laete-virens]MDL5055757.1 RNA polymerase factor sigma-54 [Oscillatoria laete-virens NRMC-F 0139]